MGTHPCPPLKGGGEVDVGWKIRENALKHKKNAKHLRVWYFFCNFAGKL